MAGGTWGGIQNKTRPAAYIDVISLRQPNPNIGDIGIMAVALPLSWGKDNELIDVFSTDFFEGTTTKTIGINAYNNGQTANLLRYAFMQTHGAAHIKVYKSTSGGTPATVSIGGLSVLAACAGLDGNQISIIISTVDELSTVTTYFKGDWVNEQQVVEIEELENIPNICSFSGTGELTDTAGTYLIGGTDGSDTEEVFYPKFLSLLSVSNYQQLACLSSVKTIQDNVIQFTKNQRDKEGRYVKATVSNNPVDSECIVNVCNGLKFGNDGEFTAAMCTIIAASKDCGARPNQSNTGSVIVGATDIVGKLTNSEIIDAIKSGKYIFTSTQGGKIQVEAEITSLHTFTAEKGKALTYLQVMRIMDEWCTFIKNEWENNFKGKDGVNNDDVGRASFKSSLVVGFSRRADLGYFDKAAFNPQVDITVAKGDDKDAVLAKTAVQPVVAMAKLYATVYVG